MKSKFLLLLFIILSVYASSIMYEYFKVKSLYQYSMLKNQKIQADISKIETFDLPKINSWKKKSHEIMQPGEIKEFISSLSSVDEQNNIKISGTKSEVKNSQIYVVNKIKLIDITPEELYKTFFNFEKYPNMKFLNFTIEANSEFLNAEIILKQIEF